MTGFAGRLVLTGDIPAHDARCAAVGNFVMSTPISPMIASAIRLSIPGALARRSRCSAKDAMWGASPASVVAASAMTAGLWRGSPVPMV